MAGIEAANGVSTAQEIKATPAETQEVSRTNPDEFPSAMSNGEPLGVGDGFVKKDSTEVIGKIAASAAFKGPVENKDENPVVKGAAEAARLNKKKSSTEASMEYLRAQKSYNTARQAFVDAQSAADIAAKKLTKAQNERDAAKLEAQAAFNSEKKTKQTSENEGRAVAKYAAKQADVDAAKHDTAIANKKALEAGNKFKQAQKEYSVARVALQDALNAEAPKDNKVKPAAPQNVKPKNAKPSGPTQIIGLDQIIEKQR